MSEGTYLKVWEDTGAILVEPRFEPSIDGAVSRWLDTGRDSLVHLTTCAGEEYTTKASAIQCWLLTTPEGRQRAMELEKESSEERKSMRVSLGLPWEEDD